MHDVLVDMGACTMYMDARMIRHAARVGMCVRVHVCVCVCACVCVDEGKGRAHGSILHVKCSAGRRSSTPVCVAPLRCSFRRCLCIGFISFLLLFLKLFLRSKTAGTSQRHQPRARHDDAVA